MAERYSNYPYRDNMANRLFSSVGPLLQSYMESKREQRKEEKQYKEQRKVLKLQNPDMKDEELDKYSRVDRGLYGQVLQSFKDTQSKKSRQKLFERLNLPGEELEGMNIADQGMLIQQKLQREGETRQDKKTLAREQRAEIRALEREDRARQDRIDAEQRLEDRFIKREVKKQQANYLKSQGFSPRQALKYAGQTVEGKTPKGMTPELNQLFTYRSQLALGKINSEDVKAINNPVKEALVTGARGNEREVMQYVQTQAVQRLGKYKNLSKMATVEKEYRILKIAKEMAAPFGINIDAPKKPTAGDILISHAQDRALKKEKKRREKERLQRNWDMARMQDWG